MDKKRRLKKPVKSEDNSDLFSLDFNTKEAKLHVERLNRTLKDTLNISDDLKDRFKMIADSVDSATMLNIRNGKIQNEYLAKLGYRETLERKYNLLLVDRTKQNQVMLDFEEDFSNLQIDIASQLQISNDMRKNDNKELLTSQKLLKQLDNIERNLAITSNNDALRQRLDIQQKNVGVLSDQLTLSKDLKKQIDSLTGFDIASSITLDSSDFVDAIQKQEQLARDITSHLNIEVQDEKAKNQIATVIKELAKMQVDASVNSKKIYDNQQRSNTVLRESLKTTIAAEKLVKEQEKRQEEVNKLFGVQLESVKSFGKELMNIATSPLTAMVTLAVLVADTIGDWTEGIKESRAELGLSQVQTLAFAKENAKYAGSALLYGYNAAKVQASLAEDMGHINDHQGELVKSAGEFARINGISEDISATFLANLRELPGATNESAINTQKFAANLAEANHVPIGILLKTVSADSANFALYADKGGKNLIKAAVMAKKLGVELSTVSGIANGLLDFETSISKQMEASALIGREINLDRARELALAGDQAGMTKEVLRQIGSENAWTKLNVLQRRALADAIGVGADDLSKMITNQKDGVKLNQEQLSGTEALNKALTIAYNLFSSIGGKILFAGAAMVVLVKSIASSKGFLKGLKDDFAVTRGIVGDIFSGLKKVIGLPFNGISGIFKSIKLPSFSAWKLPKLDFKLPKSLSLPKFNAWSIPKLNFSIPKFLSLPKFNNWSLPKLNFSLPKSLTLPKFNNWKVPSLPKFNIPKILSLPKFNSWSIPKMQFSVPKFLSLPKFNSWKIPTLPKFNILKTLSLPKFNNWSIPKLPAFNIPKLLSLPKFNNWSVPQLPKFNIPKVLSLPKFSQWKFPKIDFKIPAGINLPTFKGGWNIPKMNFAVPKFLSLPKFDKWNIPSLKFNVPKGIKLPAFNAWKIPTPKFNVPTTIAAPALSAWKVPKINWNIPKFLSLPKFSDWKVPSFNINFKPVQAGVTSFFNFFNQNIFKSISNSKLFSSTIMGISAAFNSTKVNMIAFFSTLKNKMSEFLTTSPILTKGIERIKNIFTKNNTNNVSIKPKEILEKKMPDIAGESIGKIDKPVRAFNFTNMLKGAAAITLLSGAIFIAAKAFKEFAGVNWESIGKGTVALAMLTTAASFLGRISGQILTGSTAIIALGAGLIPLAYAMSLMNKVEWKSLGVAASALGIFSAAAFALGSLMSTGVGALIFGAGIIAITALGASMAALGGGLILASAGLTSFASGIIPLLPALSNLIPLAPKLLTLSGGVMSLAGSLTALGLAGAVALPVLAALSALSELKSFDNPIQPIESNVVKPITAPIQQEHAAPLVQPKIAKPITPAEEEKANASINTKLLAATDMSGVVDKLNQLIDLMKKGGIINMDGRKVGEVLRLATSNTTVR